MTHKFQCVILPWPGDPYRCPSDRVSVFLSCLLSHWAARSDSFIFSLSSAPASLPPRPLGSHFALKKNSNKKTKDAVICGAHWLIRDRWHVIWNLHCESSGAASGGWSSIWKLDFWKVLVTVDWLDFAKYWFWSSRAFFNMLCRWLLRDFASCPGASYFWSKTRSKKLPTGFKSYNEPSRYQESLERRVLQSQCDVIL